MKPIHMLAALLVIAIWGFNFVAAKIGLEALPPIFFTALRFALVAVILVPFVAVPRGRLMEVGLVAFTLGTLHFSIMFIALTRVDASTASIAIQLQTPFAALLAAFFFGDKLGWRRAFGMALAFAGVVILVGEPRLQDQVWYVLLVVLASLIWSIANVQIKHLGAIDGMTLNGWVALLAVPQLLVVSFVFESGQIEALMTISWLTVGVIVYVALITTIVAYGLWYKLLQTYDVNQVVPFTLMVPVFGVLGGVLVLGESLTLSIVAGGLITMLGVGIITIRRPTFAADRSGRP